MGINVHHVHVIVWNDYRLARLIHFHEGCSNFAAYWQIWRRCLNGTRFIRDGTRQLLQCQREMRRIASRLATSWCFLLHANVRDQTDSYATRTAKHFRVNANSFNRDVSNVARTNCETRSEYTPGEWLYYNIHFMLEHPRLCSRERYKPVRDRLRDFDAILFAFRCDNEDCRCKIRCFIIIVNNNSVWFKLKIVAF